jgi:hypothetical protein
MDSPITETRNRPATAPRRSKFLGTALIVAAPFLAIAAFLILLAFIADYRFLILGAVLLVGGAGKLIETGRRMRAIDGWELLQRDRRPPVIFLRPFAEDDRLMYDRPLGKQEGGTLTGRSSQKRATREPKIKRAMNRIGPFVAAGRPGETLAPLGAARLYVSDQQWQQTIGALVRQAAAVVLEPEASPSTIWEVDLVAALVDPRRLLLLVPNPKLRPLGFERVRVIVSELLHLVLPTSDVCPPCDAFMFDEQSKPIPILLGGWLAPALERFEQQVRELGAPPKASAA